MSTLVLGIPLASLWGKQVPHGFATAKTTFGGEGTGAGLFTDARDIAVDREGMIYVSELLGAGINGRETGERA